MYPKDQILTPLTLDTLSNRLAKEIRTVLGQKEERKGDSSQRRLESHAFELESSLLVMRQLDHEVETAAGRY